MTTVVCDSCKKSVPGAVRKENYVTYLNKAICLSCEKKMLLTVSDKMAKKNSYGFSEYKNVLKTELEKACR